MIRRLRIVVLAALVALAGVAQAADVLWRDNDDRPVAEPEEDEEAEYLWWDGVWAMTYYQLWKIFDLDTSLHTLGELVRLVEPRQAPNVNALDEAPDSAWFTNRHARRRLSAAELARGPQRDEPPADDGALTILSGKSTGMTAGFVMKDRNGHRYVVKFDPPAYPDVPTGAEMVCSKIVWALGWHVPEYYLFRFDPARLEIDPTATTKDRYKRERPFTRETLTTLLSKAHHLPDGRIRAMASRFIEGKAKGGFRTLGRRRDDANDTVEHQDRRDLRGLRMVAAWLNFTDARRGNFYDAFVAEKNGRGHVVHYVLDFSSALGSGNDDLKAPWYGQEYFFEPKKVIRFASFGLLRPAWENVALAHPAIGYLDAEHFDPSSWRTTYPNPLFDHATVRDDFWGAKLVTSFRREDLDVVARTGEWTDPHAAEVLAEILAERQKKIAALAFDARRINPIDRFEIDRDRLRFTDLAVASGVVDADRARYRYRPVGREWRDAREPMVPITSPEIELATSHDGGERWSPSTVVRLEPAGEGVDLVGIARDTR
ncbi:MAG: hypothetical protein ACREQJ_11385 [Candidatus Binatia bacterium]